jgi:hypothetical protein
MSSHRTKRNERKSRRGRNGAALEPESFGVSKTVMIVEDNELNMKLFHDLLEANEGQHVEYEIEENRGKTSAVNLKVK